MSEQQCPSPSSSPKPPAASPSIPAPAPSSALPAPAPSSTSLTPSISAVAPTPPAPASSVATSSSSLSSASPAASSSSQGPLNPQKRCRAKKKPSACPAQAMGQTKFKKCEPQTSNPKTGKRKADDSSSESCPKRQKKQDESTDMTTCVVDRSTAGSSTSGATVSPQGNNAASGSGEWHVGGESAPSEQVWQLQPHATAPRGYPHTPQQAQRDQYIQRLLNENPGSDVVWVAGLPIVRLFVPIEPAVPRYTQSASAAAPTPMQRPCPPLPMRQEYRQMQGNGVGGTPRYNVGRQQPPPRTQNVEEPVQITASTYHAQRQAQGAGASATVGYGSNHTFLPPPQMAQETGRQLHRQATVSYFAQPAPAAQQASGDLFQDALQAQGARAGASATAGSYGADHRFFPPTQTIQQAGGQTYGQPITASLTQPTPVAPPAQQATLDVWNNDLDLFSTALQMQGAGAGAGGSDTAGYNGEVFLPPPPREDEEGEPDWYV